MHVITPAQLLEAAPKCPEADAWADALNTAMLIHGIAFDRGAVVEFLAQAAHESLSFNRLDENLNYSAERLMQVWPKRFPSLTVAAAYARAPHKLANFVYSDRMGNGPESSGDGWMFRGRGLFMITGRANYARVSQAINDSELMICPDRLQMKRIAALASAAWWSADPRLAALALDEPNDDDHADFISISKIVNGGTVGLHGREQFRDAFNRVVS